MKLSQFRQLIREEVKKMIKEEAGETTYVFQLYGMQVDNPYQGGNLTKGVSQVKFLNSFPGNSWGGEGKSYELPQPVCIHRKDSSRGYAFHLFVVATPDTFSQVLTQYVNANTKELRNLNNQPITVQIPSSEVVKIQKKTIEAFNQAV